MTNRINSPAQGMPIYAVTRGIASNKITSRDFATAAAEAEKKVSAPPAGRIERIFGDEFKGPTPINMERYRERVRVANAEFLNEVKTTLSKQGVNYQEEFSLSVDSREGGSSVTVHGSEKIKQAFLRAFESDPVLKKDISYIASVNDTVTKDLMGTTYAAEWRAALPDGTQGAVWEKYQALYREMHTKLDAVDFRNGAFTTSARQFVDQLS